MWASGVCCVRRRKEEGSSAVRPGNLGLTSSGNDGNTKAVREVSTNTTGGTRSEATRSRSGGGDMLLPSFSVGCGIALQHERAHLVWLCEQQLIGCDPLPCTGLQTIATAPMRPVMEQAQAIDGSVEATSASTATIVKKRLRHFCICI